MNQTETVGADVTIQEEVNFNCSNDNILECVCGCGMLRTSIYDDGDIGLIYYTSHNIGLREKFRLLWNILRGKDYCFWEIIIDERNKKLYQDFIKRA